MLNNTNFTKITGYRQFKATLHEKGSRSVDGHRRPISTFQNKDALIFMVKAFFAEL